MLIGAHAIIYSKDAEADRAFLRDVLRLPHIDSGGGWLIFALPPSEIAVHPGEQGGVHEVFLLTDDVAGFVADLGRRKVRCGPIQAMAWGQLTEMTLPGGGTLGVYQPRHARPPTTTRATTRTTAKRNAGSNTKRGGKAIEKPARSKPPTTARPGARKATQRRAPQGQKTAPKAKAATTRSRKPGKASGKRLRTRGRT